MALIGTPGSGGDYDTPDDTGGSDGSDSSDAPGGDWGLAPNIPDDSGGNDTDDTTDDDPSVDTGDSSGRSPGEGLVGEDDGAPELSPGGTSPTSPGGTFPDTVPEPGNIPEDTEDTEDDSPTIDTGDSSGRSPGEGLVGEEDGSPELSPGGTSPTSPGGTFPNTPPDPDNIPEDTGDDDPPADTGDSSDGVGTAGKAGAALLVGALVVGGN